jgi:hypothetical protein
MAFAKTSVEVFYLDMKERCTRCGEGCVEDSEHWRRCRDLSDEEWLELLAGGMLFTDFLEEILPFE